MVRPRQSTVGFVLRSLKERAVHSSLSFLVCHSKTVLLLSSHGNKSQNVQPESSPSRYHEALSHVTESHRDEAPRYLL
jgi:hypothetical protein